MKVINDIINFVRNNIYLIIGMIVCLIVILIICGCGCIIPVELTESEVEMIRFINETRISYGLNPLTPDRRLTNIARFRSYDMISRGYFSHYTPEGTNIIHTLFENDISYRNFGESLGKTIPAKYGTPEVFLKAWMNSYSHRNVILKYYYTDIGIGIVEDNGCRIVTVIFIRR